MATTCLLLRHAETAVSQRREWHGRADPPLSARGRAHALEAAGLLSARGLEVASISSSDQRRARETAAAFGEVLRRPVLADASLRERNLGEWTGLGREEIEAAGRASCRPGHGEVSRDLRKARPLSTGRGLVIGAAAAL